MKYGGDEPIVEETLKVIAAMFVIDPQILTELTSAPSEVDVDSMLIQAAVFHVSHFGIGSSLARS